MSPLSRRAALVLLVVAPALAGIACREMGANAGHVRPCSACVAPASQAVAVTRQVLAEEIRSRLASDGGCTLDPRTARPVGPVNAYAVSREGFERRFARLPAADQIEEYLRRHAAALSSEGLFVGAWHDEATGAYYLDLSELVADRAVAEARGRAHRQQCIYHLATGSEIRLR